MDLIQKIRKAINDYGLIYIVSHIISMGILFFRSKWATFRYSDGKGKIIFKSSNIRLIIRKIGGGELRLNGNLILESHLNMPGYVSIIIGENGKILLDNDFSLGENIRLSVGSDATLRIEGKIGESSSGITSNTTIMCNKSISIGQDFVCSWNVFITDSNWHSIFKNNIKRKDTIPVNIGKHVWIGSNVIVGPGSNIGDECIVSAFTKISNKKYPGHSTIGGISPKILAEDLSWMRDI